MADNRWTGITAIGRSELPWTKAHHDLEIRMSKLFDLSGPLYEGMWSYSSLLDLKEIGRAHV